MKELFTPSHFKAENHLPILKQIKETGVKFYITGSFALSVFKIIRRPINDLDIIVKTREDFELMYEKFGGELFEDYEKIKDTLTDVLTYANQIRTKINTVDVCIFCIEDEETLSVELDGEIFHVSYPHSTINAKFLYVNNILGNVDYLNKESGIIEIQKLKRLKKHLADIQDYCIFVESKRID